MKNDQFEDLTRKLATSPSRRQALKTLGGAMLAGLFPILGSQPAWSKPKPRIGCKGDGHCLSEFSKCSICKRASGQSTGVCESTCGFCQRCNEATGVCASTCQAAERCCDGRCVNLQTDPNNCGGCDNACASGVCEGGNCRQSSRLQFKVVGDQTGNEYTVTVSADRKSMTICDFPAGIDVHEVRLYALVDDMDKVDFEVPQLRRLDETGCVTFTAPFTTERYSTGEQITVESFAGRTWLLDVRVINADGQVQTRDLAKIPVP
jgi:hypothetical protein